MVAVWSNHDEELARATTAHDASTHERPTFSEAVSRDTVIDPPRSFFGRANAWLASIGRTIAMAMREPRLTDHLPAVPAAEIARDSTGIDQANTRAERMLLDLMCSPPEYLNAAILLVRATRALRKRGHDVFAEGFVVFALSRMLPDADGTIPINRLRDHVHDMQAMKGIVPVLLRLAEQGVVSLEGPPEQPAIAGVIDMDRMRVRLLVVP
jgi:hypothetical protein